MLEKAIGNSKRKLKAFHKERNWATKSNIYDLIARMGVEGIQIFFFLFVT